MEILTALENELNKLLIHDTKQTSEAAGTSGSNSANRNSSRKSVNPRESTRSSTTGLSPSVASSPLQPNTNAVSAATAQRFGGTRKLPTDPTLSQSEAVASSPSISRNNKTNPTVITPGSMKIEELFDTEYIESHIIRGGDVPEVSENENKDNKEANLSNEFAAELLYILRVSLALT